MSKPLWMAALMVVGAPIAALGWAPGPHERLEKFTSGMTGLVVTLKEVDASGLQRGRASRTPWSGNYLPVARGGAAARVADPAFPSGWNWRRNLDYVETRPASAVFATGDAAAIDVLSAAEKYDFVAGDGNFTLTRAMWDKGRIFQGSELPSWIGMGHGWTAASLRLAEPKLPVTLTAPNGLRVTFSPDDIKTLATALWAESKTETRVSGSRCNEQVPLVEAGSGRIASDVCRDVNPATWHLAMVNELGVSRKTFAADFAYKWEVWNKPLVSYTYYYFDPRDRKRHSEKHEPVKIAVAAYPEDPFREYRAPGTTHLVGVLMTVVAAESVWGLMPSGSQHSRWRFTYTLELDARGKVIGGEWEEATHPDFLWRPLTKRAVSLVDDKLVPKAWQGTGPVPVAWRPLIVKASAAAQPVAAIVEKLVELSRP